MSDDEKKKDGQQDDQGEQSGQRKPLSPMDLIRDSSAHPEVQGEPSKEPVADDRIDVDDSQAWEIPQEHDTEPEPEQEGPRRDPVLGDPDQFEPVYTEEDYARRYQEPDWEPYEPSWEKRKKARRVGAFGAMFWGAIGGMLTFAALFGVTIYLQTQVFGLAITGVPAESAGDAVVSHYKTALLLFQGRILLAYLAIGLVLGGFYGLAGAGFWPKEERKSRLYALACGFAGSLIVHVVVFLYGIADTPGLYGPWFHRAGEPLTAIQHMATTILVPPVTRIMVLLLLFFGVWHMTRRMRSRVAAVFVMIIAFAALVAAGAFPYVIDRVMPVKPIAADAQKPNVLLIVGDSLRPDRLGVYGHVNNTSPHIDTLAAGGFFVTENYVSIARAVPSLATLLTGQDPQTHGIRTDFPETEKTELSGALPRHFVTAGYRTAVFADYGGVPFSMLNAGFETIDAPEGTASETLKTNILAMHRFLLPYIGNRAGREIFPEQKGFEYNPAPKSLADSLIRYLDEDTSKPFFAVLYSSGTNYPMAVEYPYYKRFSQFGYDGRFRYAKPPSEDEITATEIYQIRALYDGAVEALDDQVGRIVEALKKRGAFNNTVIIVTGDRGVSLYENGEPDAGHDLHRNATLRVPMVVHGPMGFGVLGKPVRSRIDGQISLVDLAPTLLHAFGMQPTDRIDGIDFSPMVTGDATKVREAVFAETGLWTSAARDGFLEGRSIAYPGADKTLGRLNHDIGRVELSQRYRDIVDIAKHRAAIGGNYKVLYMPTDQGVQWACYNTVADPAEATNLDINMPVGCAPLRDMLIDWLAAAPHSEVQNDFVIPLQ